MAGLEGWGGGECKNSNAGCQRVFRGTFIKSGPRTE